MKGLFNGTSDGDVRLASSLRFASTGESFAMAAGPIATSFITYHIHFTSHPFASFPLAQHPFTSHTLAFPPLVPQAHLHMPAGYHTGHPPITPKAHIHLSHTTHPHTSTGDREWRRCLGARLWPN